jgi:hypothetical protein
MDKDCIKYHIFKEKFDNLLLAVRESLFVLQFHSIQFMYRGADKSFARPGRKQATATEDFDVHMSYL